MVNPQEFLTPIKPQKVYTQIVEKFIDLIEQGKFNPGLQLPPERELARQLGVSRASLRESLTVMQMLGLVETISGEGTFIAKEPKTSPLNYSLPNLGESPFLILQARKTIEPSAAALAATQRKHASLQSMTEILAWVDEDDLENQIAKGVFTEGDRQFHLEIAKATGNPILTATQKMIHDLMGQPLWLAMIRDSSFNTPGRFDESVKEHHGILDAIRNRDEQLASIRMKAHLFRVERVMKEADLSQKIQDIHFSKPSSENNIEI